MAHWTEHDLIDSIGEYSQVDPACNIRRYRTWAQQHSKPSGATISNRLGWNRAKQLAGVTILRNSPTVEPELRPEERKYVARFAEFLGTDEGRDWATGEFLLKLATTFRMIGH